MQYVPAKWFYEGRLKPIRLIVVHCTVSPDSASGAEAVANYFATVKRKASAHRTSDSNSTVMSVRDEDTAFAAAGANSDGIHLELVGYADQTEAQWLDAFSLATITEGGKSIREWSAEYDIPLRWLTVAQVRDGVTKGLCTHDDVSKAFPEVSTGHYDPGPNFPKAKALAIWSPPAPPPPPPPVEESELEIIHVPETQKHYLTNGSDHTVEITAAKAWELGTKGWKVKPLDYATWKAYWAS